jgi:hypothetical protein
MYADLKRDLCTHHAPAPASFVGVCMFQGKFAHLQTHHLFGRINTFLLWFRLVHRCALRTLQFFQLLASNYQLPATDYALPTFPLPPTTLYQLSPCHLAPNLFCWGSHPLLVGVAACGRINASFCRFCRIENPPAICYPLSNIEHKFCFRA